MFDWVLNTSLQRLSILKNRMKNVEKQGAAKKYKSMLNDCIKESHKKDQQIFMNIRTTF